MAVFKRYKGKRIKSRDKNWANANGWWISFKVGGHRVYQRSGGDTEADAEIEERQLRAEFDKRAGQIRQNPRLTFAEFVDNHYLPWSKLHKKSYRDDKGRAEVLKKEFSAMLIRQIKTTHVERLKLSLLGKDTCRLTLRTGATVNRYVHLLSAILRRALKQGYVNVNACMGVEQEREAGNRKQYLKDAEEARLLDVLVGDLAFLRPAIILALGTGMRRSELMRLKFEHINFGGLDVPYRVSGEDVSIPPNCFLVEKSKNGHARIIPMNQAVRSTLQDLEEGAAGDEFVFSFARNGVSSSTLRSGFTKACEAAGITYGTKQTGGIVWHDLRHTFATRLRTKGNLDLEIMDLMGHSSLVMTKTYAHQTPAAAQRAVDSLPQPVSEIQDLTDEVRAC